MENVSGEYSYHKSKYNTVIKIEYVYFQTDLIYLKNLKVNYLVRKFTNLSYRTRKKGTKNKGTLEYLPVWNACEIHFKCI